MRCFLCILVLLCACNGGDTEASSRVVFCDDVSGVTAAEAEAIMLAAEETGVEVMDTRTDSGREAVVVTCGGILITSEAEADELTPIGTVARIRAGNIDSVELR